MRNRSPSSGIFAGLEPAHPLNRGLVADWTITNRPGWSRGNTLRDLVQTVRKGNNGTLTNGPTWQGAKGRPGGWGSLGFDGVNDYVASTLTAPSSQLTYSAWVRPSAIGSLQLVAGDGGGWHGLRIEASGAAGATVDGGNVLTSPSVLNVGQWVHICTATSGSTQRLYLDGSLVNSGAFTVASPSAGFYIGIYFNLVSFPFSGSLDSILIHSRALSAREVAALYEETRTGNPTRFRRVKAWAFGVQAAASGTQKLPLINGGLARTGMTNGGGLISA